MSTNAAAASARLGGAVPPAFALSELGPGEFARLRTAARRSGSPAWLWPEVPVERWTEAMRHVSKAAAHVLAGTAAELPETDPMALSVACYTSGVGPLLAWWLEQGTLSAPPQSAALLLLHLDHARKRAAHAVRQSRTVLDGLSRNAIPAILLKGGYTAGTYFPDPATRPMSDLDVLVPPNRRANAEAALVEAGLQCISRSKRESSWMTAGMAREPRSLWLVRADDPWSVDLHHSLDFAATPGASLVNLDSADPFSCTDVCPADLRARGLRQPLLLLHLAVHASGGFHSLTLLRMIEIILVIRRDFRDDRPAWNEFTETAARCDGLGTAFPALQMCERLVPGTIPETVLEASATLAPPRVRAMIEKLDPATVQRVDRSSIAEHFMWVTDWRAWLRQLRSDIAPHRGSPQSVWSIYEARANRLLHRRISR